MKDIVENVTITIGESPSNESKQGETIAFPKSEGGAVRVTHVLCGGEIFTVSNECYIGPMSDRMH